MLVEIYSGLGQRSGRCGRKGEMFMTLLVNSSKSRVEAMRDCRRGWPPYFVQAVCPYREIKQ